MYQQRLLYWSLAIAFVVGLAAHVGGYEPGGQPGWRIASLGFLAAALALVGGLAVLAATRPSRGPRVGQAP